MPSFQPAGGSHNTVHDALSVLEGQLNLWWTHDALSVLEGQLTTHAPLLKGNPRTIAETHQYEYQLQIWQPTYFKFQYINSKQIE